MAERIMVEGLVKRFGPHAALDRVSFIAEPGTFLVLLGPSGSGKSTLVRCLAGIEHLTSGTIVLGDTTVATEGMHLAPERRGLSMVFQDYALWPHLDALHNVAFALRRSRTPKAEAIARATEMLERVGLAPRCDRFPSQLSGGEQQRVALARALIGGTGILLFDEPLSNLDADLRERMRIEIASLVRDLAVTAVYITHDQSEAFALADQVGVLQDGALVQFDTPESVYARPANAFVARFTGLSADLPGQVVGRSATAVDCVQVTVSSRSGLRPIEAHRGACDTAAGKIRIMIRPSAVHFCAPHSDDCQLVGSVTDAAFRGRGYEHAVQLEGGPQVTGIFHHARFARGETVGLTIESNGCMAFSTIESSNPSGSEPSTVVGDVREPLVTSLDALAVAK